MIINGKQNEMMICEEEEENECGGGKESEILTVKYLK